MVNVFLLTVSLYMWVPALAAQNQKGTATSGNPARSCTDLSGEPVPCPEGHNRVVLPSAQSGSAVVRRCVDLLGNDVACPGESATQPGTTEDAVVPVTVPRNASVEANSSKNTSGASPTSKKTTSVVRASSTKTSVEPAESANDSPCHDLLGQPVSCPLDTPAEAAATGVASATSSSAGGAPTSSAIYVAPTGKPQTSLERSLPRNIYLGQKEFWTAPARMRLDDAYWAVPFGITTGGLMAADVSIKNALPQSPGTIKNFKSISNYGALGYGALVGGTYLLGKGSHNSYMSDTAWLAGEAGLNSFIATYGLKYAFGRQRPTEGNGQGDFFSGGQSFPSEHAAAVWSVATVFAGRYPGTLTKLGMFGGAALVSASRVIGQQHFASDAFVGSAMGFYFGRQALKRYEREHATDAMYGKFVVDSDPPSQNPANMGSPYVPLESWVYPVLDRLSAMGYAPSAIMGQRPWTRLECARLVEEAKEKMGVGYGSDISSPALSALVTEFAPEITLLQGGRNLGVKVESIYTRLTEIAGKPLTDGYHFGQTIYNDYGRPYQQGFNNITGFSSYAVAGPFAFYVNGEYQHAPGAPPLSDAVRTATAAVDWELPVAPAVPMAAINHFRLLSAYASFTTGGWQTSFGLQPVWWGADAGGDLIFSNNAEPVLMARFSRVTPLKMPFLFKWMGPVKTDVFFGQLQGQEYVYLGQNLNELRGTHGVSLNPQPFLMGYKISFKPTPNLELGFSLTDVFSGSGRPLTFDTFFHEFGSRGSTITPNTGDRRTGFDFRWRVPGLRKWLILYNGSMAEDESTPLLFPRRSAQNPGIYVPQVPKIPKLDLWAEGLYTDLPGLNATGYFYINQSYPEGYTKNGNILGSWVGRQGRGIQVNGRYWFGPQTTVQFGYRKQGVSPDFLEGGTVHDFMAKANILLRSDLSLTSTVQYERWNFPLLAPASKNNVVTSFGVVFRPELGRRN